MIRLGINVDHVAGLRQARGTRYPNPVAAAALAEKAGADQITVHLREDRRHIQESDCWELRSSIQTSLNLEMAPTTAMTGFASDLKPDCATLVPERRQEKTTERGLTVVGSEETLAPVVRSLKQAGVEVSLFVDPEQREIDAAIHLGVDRVELHTGTYALEQADEQIQRELQRLKKAAEYAKELGLSVAGGHGLNMDNLEALIRFVPIIEEYNIGHWLVCRSLFVGFEEGVREVKRLLESVGGR